MTELKPCPFCGAEAIWLPSISDDIGMVCCEGKDCHARINGYKDNAIKEWNRRVNE